MTPVAVMLPGTGSDEVFVDAAFGAPMASVGIRLVAPRPEPSDLVAAGLRAFDAAAAEAPVLVGGVSFGAHLAATWAIGNRDRCAGLLAVMPAWTGPADGSPAARAANASASLIREHGLPAALDVATGGVAPWLATELRRAWPRQGRDLVAGLTAAAAHPAPDLAELSTLDVPAAVVTCTDDAVHPADVAYAWVGALPDATLATTTLDAVGADPATLGRVALEAYDRAPRPGPSRTP